jgi:glycosyltransferase involved in cell wall biosynthesis
VGPLPPPYHGATVSTSLVLANPHLRRHFQVEHLDTSDHRGPANIGMWDVRNVGHACLAIASIMPRLRGRRGVVYLPLSQNAPAFLRDSILIREASLARWKIAVHLRGSEFRDFYRGASGPFQRWIRFTLKQVSSVAVMGSSLRWVFDGFVPEDRIAVVPNGTPDPGLNGVSKDSQTVLFLSNLRRRKGLIEAVEAALIVLQKRRTARFLFVGEWESPTLECTVRQRAASAGDRILFLPAAVGAEKDQILRSATMLLFPPSEPEGHPRVVLEALAAGLPVVTTNRGAIAETVVDGQSGFVLQDPDPDELAACVLALLDDAALRESFADAARARYLEHFTQQAADEQLATWLRGIAEADN